MSLHFHCVFTVTLLYFSLLNATPFFQDYEDPVTAKRFAEFNCYKHRTCTPGPPKQCGYDIKTMELAEFEDMCTMFDVNCKGGFFKLVDMLACESKKAFMSLQNSTMFQWQHINRTFIDKLKKRMNVLPSTTTESTTLWQKVMPGLVQLVLSNLF